MDEGGLCFFRRIKAPYHTLSHCNFLVSPKLSDSILGQSGPGFLLASWVSLGNSTQPALAANAQA
jgi:hypothetical protein